MTSVLLMLTLLSVPFAANAQGVRSLAPGNCPGQVYPFRPDATVQVSTTTPAVGEKIEVSGVNYCHNEDVTITIDGKKVGTGHTDGTGAFDPSVVVPAPAGTKTLCGIGATGLDNDADCLQLTARTTNGNPAGPSGGGGGGPAFTGVEVASLCAIALLLLAGGVAFATAGRRRPKTVA